MNVRGRRFLAFWKAQGTAAAVRLIFKKLGTALAGGPIFNEMPTWVSEKRPPTVGELAASDFSAVQPLPTYLAPPASLPRVSLVTDSVGSSSLFGGVGTALLLAAQLANRMNAVLRIVTRTEEASPQGVVQVLGAYGVELIHETQFVFSPSSRDGRSNGLDLQPGELFVTTSWWSTAATLSSVPHDSIIYLLQEDERMFYPFGEHRLRCEEVFKNRSIRFLLNTRMLYEHMIASGLAHFRTQALWFEPAFPDALFHPREREPGSKRRLFFYARPNNPRNLFGTGLAIIERAIHEGVLDLDRWDIYLVGSGIPEVSFGDGYVPTRCEGLGWKSYADLVGSIDLGLSLMYTPHPSYPPLDLAASGAVVITNKFGIKQDMTSYSRNILCVDLDSDSLLAGIRAGIALAEDEETRSRNYRTNGLGKSWTGAFEPILDSLATR